MLDFRFASGDILALRRFPVASIGIGYTSVWHRGADGEWTLFADVPRTLGCSRYFADLFAHAIVAPIRIDWRGPVRWWSRSMAEPNAQVAAGSGPERGTTIFNAAARFLPPASWVRRRPFALTQSFWTSLSRRAACGSSRRPRRHAGARPAPGRLDRECQSGPPLRPRPGGLRSDVGIPGAPGRALAPPPVPLCGRRAGGRRVLNGGPAGPFALIMTTSPTAPAIRFEALRASPAKEESGNGAI